VKGSAPDRAVHLPRGIRVGSTATPSPGQDQRGTEAVPSARELVARRNTIASSANVLKILDLLARRGHVALAEAAASASVSTSTAYRLLSTLESSGLADRVPGKGYRPGAKMLEWSMSLLVHLDTRTAAQPILRALAATSGSHVFLALLRDTGLTTVEIIPPSPDAPPRRWPGMTGALHATGGGKAVAIHLEPTRLAELLGPEPYQRFTGSTPTTWRELRPQLDLARSRGYAVAINETQEDWTGVGAAILVRGEAIGAVSLAGPAGRFNEETIDLSGQRVMRAAAEIGEIEGRRTEPVGDRW
jgi:DNA-binding IclR family transcriptional regulator